VTGAIERFTAAAQALGLQPEVHRFPEGTKTAADAARAIGCEVDQIVKSLVFMADGVAVLALTAGSNRVDEAKLATVAGAADVRRATPEEARSATGFSVGGTPPFGHLATVRTFIDQELMRHDVVWAAGGTPDSVFPMPPMVLGHVTHGRVADFTG
jgi:prolyl-tRNA editing enzyme YbaK/EbsC (Cys-tRNA(Pro) deacylase)